jgi:hypothetical protein
MSKIRSFALLQNHVIIIFLVLFVLWTVLGLVNFLHDVENAKGIFW